VELWVVGAGDGLAARNRRPGRLAGQLVTVCNRPLRQGRADSAADLYGWTVGLGLTSSLPAFPVGRRQTVKFISTFEKFDANCLQRDAAIMQHMATADAARDLDLLRHA